MFKNKKIPHAIILDNVFSESDESRLTIAKEIAAFCVCKDEEDKPCGKCQACIKVKDDNHPDVIKVGESGNSKSFHIDNIRKIRQEAYVLPNEADKKVYILDFADNMTVQAQNALLKILEEPPKSVVFVLVCKSSANLLQTIRSRCQIFSLESKIEYDDKLKLLINNIIDGIISPMEWDLLSSTSKLIKDKVLFKKVVDILIDIFSGALRETFGVKYNSDFCSQEKKLSSRFTKSAIIKGINSLEKSKAMLESNANMNLLVSLLCLNLRSCQDI